MRDRFGSASAVITLIALSLSTFMYVTTETLPIGLLSLIADDLDSTTSAVGLLVTVYALVVVLASIPLTKVTQRLPRRLVLCVLLVVFVVATAASALSQGYWILMIARMVTASSQALFWAVVTPAAAALFMPEVRARAICILFAGSSIAALAGVPAGTWLGQQTSWRIAFFALSILGLLLLLTIALLMPNTPAGHSDTDHGWAPDAGRYWTLVVYTALSVTGAFTALTYIAPFLTDESGFGDAAISPLLFVRGLAGLIGVVVVAHLVNRNGWLTMSGLIAVQALALAAQWLFSSSQAGTVISISTSGFTLAALSAALGARVLEVAPNRSDMAAAGTSTAFNVGITAGAFLGGILLPAAGVRSTALAGAALTVGALVVVLIEPSLSSRRRMEADGPVTDDRTNESVPSQAISR
jgi:DHA1 family inner membrane transport protein